MITFLRALWKANFHKKRTYGSGIMKLFGFKTHMEQLGQHQKKFHNIFSKENKNYSIFLDFYEHGKL